MKELLFLGAMLAIAGIAAISVRRSLGAQRKADLITDRKARETAALRKAQGFLATSVAEYNGIRRAGDDALHVNLESTGALTVRTKGGDVLRLSVSYLASSPGREYCLAKESGHFQTFADTPDGFQNLINAARRLMGLARLAAVAPAASRKAAAATA